MLGDRFTDKGSHTRNPGFLGVLMAILGARFGNEDDIPANVISKLSHDKILDFVKC